jgi:hypothetical protein
VKKQFIFLFVLFILLITGLMIGAPQKTVQAQCDPAAGPCPTNVPPENENKRRTPTPIRPSQTPTSTPTFTATSTPTNTLTHTPTATATIPSATSTVTFTPTTTPVLGNSITNWIPGVGIGAVLLLIVVGIFLPAIQKVRVSNRGY